MSTVMTRWVCRIILDRLRVSFTVSQKHPILYPSFTSSPSTPSFFSPPASCSPFNLSSRCTFLLLTINRTIRSCSSGDSVFQFEILDSVYIHAISKISQHKNTRQLTPSELTINGPSSSSATLFSSWTFNVRVLPCSSCAEGGAGSASG